MRTKLSTSILLAAISAAAGLPGQTGSPALDPAIIARLDDLLSRAEGPPPGASPDGKSDEIWRACAVRYGELTPLLAYLDTRIAAKLPRPDELRLLRLKAHYLRRLGDVLPARRTLDRIRVEEESVADNLAKAEVLDALGQDQEAVATYDRLLKREIDVALKNRILLRRALMTKPPAPTKPPARAGAVPGRAVRTLPLAPAVRAPRRPGADPSKAAPKKKSELARFAAGADVPPALKNQAAFVLALTNEQQAAIEIFIPEGEGTSRFRQEIRIAEWAIEAGAYDKAQEAGWRAVGFAKLKRDRRYALTILVEAYRRNAKLDDLIAKFAAAESLDVESRETWIDLLRERGKIDEALRLFHGAKEGRFTADMRRELLEICREANNDEVLESAYKKLIADEPRFLEWREGLARFYLERGRRAEAEAVWRPYLEVTDDSRYRMAAAASLMEIGLDDLAVHFARACISAAGSDEKAVESALLFLFELHRDRGRHDEATKVLDELDRIAKPGAGIRKEMADAFARLGDKKRAVAALDNMYVALGDKTTPDTRMKLALMLSEIGEEERALQHWQALWGQINSVPRRRYVEERLMNVASRLGKLAKIAIDLEKKLIAGTADDRDAGLLVRLYIQVNDPVSATEVIQEHMSKSGKKPVDVLTEKARVFQSCNDYYNYEKVVQELIEVDPDGRADYLRQLAMSNMERGQRREAREILERLKKEESDVVSDEFEAGVLALAGMRTEALRAYRRGIAKHPERIDTYLLLSNIQKELGQHDRSAGMFQYLAATAERDDLFTIAVDGILNMRDGRSNRGAPNRLVEWTRRIVLERVARRPDKLYLLRLVADLSEELNDTGMAIRALKTAVPVAGEQRTQILRELMTMAKQLRLPPHLRALPAGVRLSMGRNQQPKNTPPNPDLLMFGRRILGQGELVPPQTYLELGTAFLDAGEVSNATKTFNQASQLPEFAEMRRQFAQAFEVAGYPKEALRLYEQILSIQHGDAGLITKVGELLEQTDRDDVALGLYERGMELLLNRSVFVKTGVSKEEKKPAVANPFVYMLGERNTDDWQRHHRWMLSGLLTTSTEVSSSRFLEEQIRHIDADLERALAERRSGRLPKDGKLQHHPRLARRITLYRRVAIAFGRIEMIDALDRRIADQFVADDSLLEDAVRFRLTWGYVASARKLIAESKRPEAERKRLRLLAGGAGASEVVGMVSVPEAASLLLPLLVADEQDTARTLLERLSLSTGDANALEHVPLLVGGAVYLRDTDLALSLCRHWLNLAVRHAPGTMYMVVENVLRQGRMILDDAQLKSLTEHLLGQVVENPDKFSIFLRRLPQLREQAGPDFLTREQIEALIKSRLDASDQFIYGLEDMFALLAASDRSPVLRSVWDRLPKTQRAYFLLRLISVLDNEFDSGFADFLTAAFKTALADADDTRILGYQVDSLAATGTVNHAVRLKLIDALIESGESGMRILGSRAILLVKLDRVDEALAELGKVLAATFPETGAAATDPMARNAYYRITNSMRGEHGDLLLTAFDKFEKNRKPGAQMVRNRLELLARLGRTDDIAKLLETALQKYPDDRYLRSRLASHLSSRGEQAKALAIHAAALQKTPANQSLREQVVAGWRGLRQPIQALAVLREGEKHEKKPAAKTEEATNIAETKERTPQPTPAVLKKAIADGDELLAKTTFRRLWRTFSPSDDNPYARMFVSRIISNARLIWPPDEAEKKSDETENERPRDRGGLPEMFTRELTADEKKRTRYKRPVVYYPGAPQQSNAEVTPVQSVLIKHEFGVQEIQRQLRAMDAHQLGSMQARDIYGALIDAAVTKDGRKTVMEQVLAREKAGRSGKVDYGMLAALLDDAISDSNSTPTGFRQSLRGLTENLNPRDENQVRRLARLHAAAGDQQQAATLYRWCALLSGSSQLPYYYRGQNDLLEEVIERLDGDARTQTVTDILAFQDPGEYGRDPYLRIVLQTWSDLLPPSEALEKSRRALAEVTAMEMLPHRQACKLACVMHARAGEIEPALRCLEIALCRLEPPANSRYPYYADMFRNPGYASLHDMAMLFPFGMADFVDAAGWLEAAYRGVSKWRTDNRLNERIPLQLLGLLSLRLHQHGKTELARKALEEIAALAGDRSDDLLWVSDIARLVGDTDRADQIELELFESGRLHVERVPDIIGRILATDSPRAALEAGSKALDWTLHPKLLERLIAAATAEGLTDRVAEWKKLLAEANAARETLAEEDRKRVEEAKKRGS